MSRQARIDIKAMFPTLVKVGFAIGLVAGAVIYVKFF